MLKTSLLIFLLLSFTALFAQETGNASVLKKYAVSDSIKVDSIALKKSSIKSFCIKNQVWLRTVKIGTNANYRFAR